MNFLVSRSRSRSGDAAAVSPARRLLNLPLRRQLMLAFAIVAIVTTAISTGTLTTLAGHRMHGGLHAKSLRLITQIRQQLESRVAVDDTQNAQTAFDSLRGDRDIDGLAVYTPEGELIGARGSHPPRLAAGAVDTRTDSKHISAIGDVRTRQGRIGRVYVSLSTAPIDELHRRDSWTAAGIGTAVVICALILGLQTSKRIVRRLVDIAAAADRLASGDLRQPSLDDAAHDEIGALAHAFNVMVGELNRFAAEHERLVATERERLESLVAERTQALEQSREMFRLIAESTHAVPFTLDLVQGSFPYIGPQGVLQSGIPLPRWQEPGALDAIVPRDSNPALRERFDRCTEGPFEFEATLTGADHRRREVRWMGTCESGASSRLLRGLMHDVTDLRTLERELAAAQKLESVGRLAAGVAHEINTPLQFVTDNIRFVGSNMADVGNVVAAYGALLAVVESGRDSAAAVFAARDAERTADLEYLMGNIPPAVAEALEGLDRITTIVQSMKEFAHPDAAQKTFADLNQAIRSTLVVARNEYKHVADVEVDLGEIPPVECYLGEINQVLLNVLVNAAHAIGDVVSDGGPHGKLTIRTRMLDQHVEISITDTGTGIPEAVRARIFDPFFTTKEVGRGTGQGLAIARSVIVKKHAGTLSFDSECGRGTTFYIRLPAVPPAAQPARLSA